MKTLSITVLVTVLLLAAGFVVVYRMPAPEVMASKYILHIDPNGPAGSAAADHAAKLDAPSSGSSIPASIPSDGSAQYDQAIRQQSGLGASAPANDGAGTERPDMARGPQEMAAASPGGDDTPRGTVSPWDEAPAVSSATPSVTPPADAGGRITTSGLAPSSVKRIPAPADTAPASPVAAASPASPASPVAAAEATSDDRSAAAGLPGHVPASPKPQPASASAAAPSSPGDVSSAASATEARPGKLAAASKSRPAANSWLTQSVPQHMPIPPLPRRRADQLPPIPRGAEAAPLQ